MYLNQKIVNISSADGADFELIQVKNLDLYTEYVNEIFDIGKSAQNKLKIILSEKSKENLQKSFLGYLNVQICCTVCMIKCDPVYFFILNLGILPKFRNLGLSKKILNNILVHSENKNFYIHTDVNGILCKYVLPNLGYEFLGKHNLLDLDKLCESFKLMKKNIN
ncbi:hypothetical protein [Fluviispira multicolorata]|uniref:N-acetyltransferase domain-containing protein n=1 Tax=Fluviispira multicolorata TaxID=2654512 RepID=A0A833JDE3_9BACT|nr:hypothetical protein [Fluviispira multicolorata]KAB8031863.1 hypothetical protein GCL57_04255 [Fluviispira multicolorata]